MYRPDSFYPNEICASYQLLREDRGILIRNIDIDAFKIKRVISIHAFSFKSPKQCYLFGLYMKNAVRA